MWSSDLNELMSYYMWKIISEFGAAVVYVLHT
ncbi:hypothetical protein HNQ64_002242 [Prosthecobacter dejongeii]|uniref:Uncharacterized protein n=1 Tax=Prosthecobacter dejongeii TaxID=48465 RepID=A0A7W8DPT6_9BACT|nr:hypothetical protein [Prosthecobacter dejongeii]